MNRTTCLMCEGPLGSALDKQHETCRRCRRRVMERPAPEVVAPAPADAAPVPHAAGIQGPPTENELYYAKGLRDGAVKAERETNDWGCPHHFTEDECQADDRLETYGPLPPAPNERDIRADAEREAIAAVVKMLRERARLHRVAAHECGADDAQVYSAAELLLSDIADDLEREGVRRG